MKRLICVILALPLFCAAGAAQTAPTGEPIVSADGRAVFATIAKWGDAVRDRDQKALDLIFEEYMIVTGPDGRTRGKKEEMELFKPAANLKAISIKNEDIKVRVFGETAVATALAQMHFNNGGKDVQTAFRYTATLVKKDGRWQIVALHTSNPSRTSR